MKPNSPLQWWIALWAAAIVVLVVKQLLSSFDPVELVVQALLSGITLGTVIWAVGRGLEGNSGRKR